jgi:peptide chain release factor 1
MHPLLGRRLQWHVCRCHRHGRGGVLRTIHHQNSGSLVLLSSAMEQRLLEMRQRHEDILEEMKNGGRRLAKNNSSNSLSKELQALAPIARLLDARQALDEEEASLQELALEADKDDADDDLQKECQIELDRIRRHRTTLEQLLLDASLPPDEDDTSSDAIVEVRAGTGGDEASLFAGELWQCYKRTALSLRWKVEVLTESFTEIGGLREASLSISGPASYELAQQPLPPSSDEADYESFLSSYQNIMLGPYGVFKFESGVHRVQRIPVNDSKIHTSACSVAVLPFVSSSSHNNDGHQLLPMSELKIETMRSSGAGGQHVNCTDSAVRITHIPTKITASIQDERSQHQNKEKALKLVAARVHDLRRSDAERALGETRSSLMGGGDRSERIRTYNFPQDRVTDHRCKETRHGIASLMSGTGSAEHLVVAYLPLLKVLHRQEKLQSLDEKKDKTTLTTNKIKEK